MTHWRETLITPDQTMLSTIEIIDQTAFQIALVVDAEDRLVGTVTDGDIRRALLKGVGMEEPIKLVMNKSPFTVQTGYDVKELKVTMSARKFHQAPVLDQEHRVIDLVVIDDLLTNYSKHDNWVVLMAGGLGKRLRPLTENIPKPLIEVGGKPILETILEKFVDQGFQRFYISVNYKRDLIKDHFGSGKKWDVEIRYLDENEALGTAGALSLIPETPDKPIIVMNGDLMTDVDFGMMMDFHDDHRAMGTMGVRKYDFQVQFGVVQIENGSISSVNEKPVQKFLVNAGIYVLAPETLKDIPKGQQIDMPTLFNNWTISGKTCAAFPIHEYWLDVGRVEDLEIAEQKAKINAI